MTEVSFRWTTVTVDYLLELAEFTLRGHKDLGAGDAFKLVNQRWCSKTLQAPPITIF